VYYPGERRQEIVKDLDSSLALQAVT